MSLLVDTNRLTDFFRGDPLALLKLERTPEVWLSFVTLAEFKVNQFQLYIEHTFAYRDHRDVWKDASPMTGPDIRRRG